MMMHGRSPVATNVLGARRAVYEVPRLERPLLALDEQQALTGQDEEVLLRGLGVVRDLVRLGQKTRRLIPRSANGALSPSEPLALSPPTGETQITITPGGSSREWLVHRGRQRDDLACHGHAVQPRRRCVPGLLVRVYGQCHRSPFRRGARRRRLDEDSRLRHRHDGSDRAHDDAASGRGLHARPGGSRQLHLRRRRLTASLVHRHGGERCAARATGTLGTKTISVTAKDVVGQTLTLARTYKVVYAFQGFFDPVRNPPALNAQNAGSVIPMKFSLGGNQGLNIFATGSPQVAADQLHDEGAHGHGRVDGCATAWSQVRSVEQQLRVPLEHGREVEGNLPRLLPWAQGRHVTSRRLQVQLAAPGNGLDTERAWHG
jgi:hypothetical protein